MKIIIVRQMIRNVCKYIFYIWEDSEGVNSHSDVTCYVQSDRQQRHSLSD